MWTDYLPLLPSIAAVLNSVIAVIVAQFYKEHRTAKFILVFASIALGTGAIVATVYSQHTIEVAKQADKIRKTAIRDNLGMLIAEGDTLIVTASSSKNVLPSNFGTDWLMRANGYLQKNLGGSYVSRMNDPSEAPIDFPVGLDDYHHGFYYGLRYRVVKLERFLQEMKD